MLRYGGMINIKFSKGFTLVELVAVIVLLGILSVYAVPRLFDGSDVAATVFQSRAISILRNIQTRAMQDTRKDGYCYKVNFDSGNNTFGVPSLNYESTSDSAQIAETCATTIDTSSDTQFYYVTSDELNADGISMVARANNGDVIASIEFDSLGRANQNDLECDLDSVASSGYSGCRIEFIGDSSAYVCVESEGYIYACDTN